MVVRVLIALTMAFAVHANGSSPLSFSYQGRLYDAAGTTPLDGSFDVTFTVLSPDGNCILFEEQFLTLDLTASSGTFAEQIGTGAPTANDSGNSLLTVFTNRAAAIPAFTDGNCPSGNWTPSVVPVPEGEKTRLLRITIFDGATTTVLSPDQIITSVPTAMIAEQLSDIPTTEIRSLLDGTHAVYGNFVLYNDDVSGTPQVIGTSGVTVEGSLNAEGNVIINSLGNPQLAIGTSMPAAGVDLHIERGDPTLRLSSTTNAGANSASIEFYGDATATNAMRAKIEVPDNANEMHFHTGAGEAMYIDSLDLHLLGDLYSKNIVMSANTALGLGTYAVDPGGLLPGHAGYTWYNSAAKAIKYWDGTTIHVIGTTGAGDNLGDHTATQDLDLNSNSIINLDAPVAGGDAVNKTYADTRIGGTAYDNTGLASGRMLLFDGTNWVVTKTVSTDGTFAADSDDKIPTEKAIKAYVDTEVAGAGDNLGDHTATSNLVMGANSIIGGTGASANLTLESTTDVTKGYLVLQPTGGNVGIGVTNPSGLMHIKTATTPTPGSALIVQNPYNAAPISRVNIDLIADSPLTNVVRLSSHRVGASHQAFSISTTNAGTITERVRISHDGKLGIGTDAPDSALHVVGQVKVTGGSPGAGKVLTSDANGLATWETPGAGADDLGDHTATQALQMAGFRITNDGTAGDGILVNADGTVALMSGASVNEFSIDGTLAGNSDAAVPTEKAVKTYADSNLRGIALSAPGAGQDGQAITWDDTGGAWVYTDVLSSFTESDPKVGTLTDQIVPFWDADTGSGQLVDSPIAVTAAGHVNVDSNTLFVKTDDNRVGVGTAAPSSALHIGNGLGSNTVSIQKDNAGQALIDFQIADGTVYKRMGMDANENFFVSNLQNGSTFTLDRFDNLVMTGANSSGMTLYYNQGTNPTNYVSSIKQTGATAVDGVRGLVVNVEPGAVATNYGFAVNFDNSNKFIVNKDGNVGIGATDPEARLHVVGQVKITGGTPGAGKVLTSDADGLATWEAPGAGADDLGDHTATEALKMAGFRITNDGTAGDGILVNADGTVTLMSGASVNEFSVDGTLADNSDSAVPTEKAVKTYADTKIGGSDYDNTGLAAGSMLSFDGAEWNLNRYLSTDGTFTGADNNQIPTALAIKTYVDNEVSGSGDDLGNHTATEALQMAGFRITNDGTAGDGILINADGTIALMAGSSVNEFSIDGTLADNSDAAVPTEKAVKTYADSNLRGIALATPGAAQDGQAITWDDTGGAWVYADVLSSFTESDPKVGTLTDQIIPFWDADTGSGQLVDSPIAITAAGHVNVDSNTLFVKTGDNRVGIGTDTPTARLHLAAGTATANTAPLKFTSGTVLATPEDGAFEFDGADYYVTAAGTRKKLAASTGGSADYVLKAGDTMTGDLVIDKANGLLTIKEGASNYAYIGDGWSGGGGWGKAGLLSAGVETLTIEANDNGGTGGAYLGLNKGNSFIRLKGTNGDKYVVIDDSWSGGNVYGRVTLYTDNVERIKMDANAAAPFMTMTGNGHILLEDAAGVDKIKLNSSGDSFISGGDLGIGTETPDSALHVVGQVKITGGSPGAGKVLTSDADGLATWETPGTGADDLGDHTATENIVLGAFWLSGDGGNEGIQISAAGRVSLTSGASITGFSTDGTFAGNSDDVVPTEKAIKSYADSKLASKPVAVPGATEDDKVLMWDDTGDTWVYSSMAAAETDPKVGALTNTFIPVWDSTAPGVLVDSGLFDDGTTIGTTGASGRDVNFDANTLFVDASTDRVGIGTTAPDTKLNIAGDVASSAGLSVGQLHVTGATNTNQRINIGYDTTGDYGFVQAGILGTGYRNLALLPNGGNVGMGTTSPDEKLEVTGNILTSGRVAIGGGTLALSACISNNGADRLFHDTDCDGTKDAGEEFVDLAAGTETDPKVGSLTNLYIPFWDNAGTQLDDSPIRITSTADPDVDIDANTLYVDVSANRVGVGTSAPGHTLHVGPGTGTKLRIDRAAATVTMNNAGALEVGVDAGLGTAISGQTGGTGAFGGIFQNTSGAVTTVKLAGGTTFPYAATFENGNVGIGTPAPANRLHVVSADNANYSAAKFQSNNLTQTASIGWRGISGTHSLIYDAVGDGTVAHSWAVGGTSRMTMQTTGAIISTVSVQSAQLRGVAGGTVADHTWASKQLYLEGLSTNNPAIGFHIPSVAAGTLNMNEDGNFAFWANGGGAYSPVHVGTPTATTHAATKAYVDSVAGGPASWTCTLRAGSFSAGTGGRTSTATCSGNEKVVSGGCEFGGENEVIYDKYSRPTSQGWRCYISSTANVSVTAYANCCL